MMIAHGPNKWWNDKKSKIWIQEQRKDNPINWFLMYINRGQYDTSKANVIRWTIIVIWKYTSVDLEIYKCR